MSGFVRCEAIEPLSFRAEGRDWSSVLPAGRLSSVRSAGLLQVLHFCSSSGLLLCCACSTYQGCECSVHCELRPHLVCLLLLEIGCKTIYARISCYPRVYSSRLIIYLRVCFVKCSPRPVPKAGAAKPPLQAECCCWLLLLHHQLLCVGVDARVEPDKVDAAGKPAQVKG